MASEKSPSEMIKEEEKEKDNSIEDASKLADELKRFSQTGELSGAVVDLL